MKPSLVLLLCCLTFELFAQTIDHSGSKSGITTEIVKFKSGRITLEGTVYKPEHPYAAIVLVHGSGQERRMDGMALVLAEHGLAVLTYDKRGVGKSGGIYAGPEIGTNNIDSANLELLAADASAASKELLTHLAGKHIILGLLGASQAGWVIPLSAKKSKQVSFMVIFSGPVVTTLEQLRFQFYTEGKPDFWETHLETEVRQHIKNDPDRYQFSATDPVDALNSLSIHGLWLFGGEDVQVPVQLSIDHLDQLKSEGKLYEYRLFPGLGHNTSFLKSEEPTALAIQWIKSLAESNSGL